MVINRGQLMAALLQKAW